MRTVRLSLTARMQFQKLLRDGAQKFGIDVADEKRALVETCLRTYLAEYPHHGFRMPRKRLFHYPVTDTPFAVVYDYDDAALRVFYIVHQRADKRRLKARDAMWE
jgi:plasmid stabilization system protein ParE